MDEIVVATGRYPYAEMIDRLTKAIAAAGATLFANIDQSAAAKTVGLSLRPTTLLIFGNPKGGTPLMDAFPHVALDLPLKFVIWEQDGSAFVAYVPMRVIAARYGVMGLDNLVIGLDRTLQTLTADVI